MIKHEINFLVAQILKDYRYFFEDWCGHDLSVELTATKNKIPKAYVDHVIRSKPIYY